MTAYSPTGRPLDCPLTTIDGSNSATFKPDEAGEWRIEITYQGKQIQVTIPCRKKVSCLFVLHIREKSLYFPSSGDLNTFDKTPETCVQKYTFTLNDFSKRKTKVSNFNIGK